jgi:FkbM family methyltransferase
MSLAKLLNKPEYLYRPSSVFRKLFRPTSANQLFVTPWKTRITADWQDAIGGSIGMFGIYDLATTEVLWRMIQPGNFVLDVGANIGYMTGLCSYRAQTMGTVWAFEPNILLLDRLKENILKMPYGNVRLFELGLSDEAGTANLIIPQGYQHNAGVAYIQQSTDTSTHRTIEIPLKQLDSIIPADIIIDVMKIDVEGHELSVFHGAPALLKEKRIRNIIFEDLQQYPSSVTNLLSKSGYIIYRIQKTINRVKLADPDSPPPYKSKTTNYLATVESEKVQALFDQSGYKCLNRTT